MNLLQLQSRINQMVAENNARWPERNELPMMIELPRRGRPTAKHPAGRVLRQRHYRKVDHVSSAMTGIRPHGDFLMIVAREETLMVGKLAAAPAV